jgi:hypothetical protein
VLRRIFGRKRDEVGDGWWNLRNEQLIMCAACHILLELSSHGRWHGQCIYHGREKVHRTFLQKTGRKQTIVET